jgi:hypothetical protein
MTFVGRAGAGQAGLRLRGARGDGRAGGATGVNGADDARAEVEPGVLVFPDRVSRTSPPRKPETARLVFL